MEYFQKNKKEEEGGRYLTQTIKHRLQALLSFESKLCKDPESLLIWAVVQDSRSRELILKWLLKEK